MYSILIALCAFAALLFMSSHHSATVAMRAERSQPTPFTAEYYQADSQRFGAALNRRVKVTVNGEVRGAQISDYDVGALHLGWYTDADTKRDPPGANGIRYGQLVLVKDTVYPTNTIDLSDSVAANPGALWLVGNEPEGKIRQGNRTPEQYAQIYHDMHTLIKSLDPTAQIAIGGVILPTPLRLEWLDKVLREYETRYGEEMPVDVWNIHVQILQEKAGAWGAEIPAGLEATEGELFGFSIETGYYDNANPEIFKRLVTDFRQWMKDKGFQDKPLIISEYGVLFPSTYIGYGEGYGDEDSGNRVLIDFMYQTFDFLVNAKDPDLGYARDDYRLVQQWLWYSLNTQPYDADTGRGYNGNLFSHLDPNEMTLFGEALREYVRTLLRLKVFLPSMMKPGAPG
jgi:hypothetical protein